MNKIKIKFVLFLINKFLCGTRFFKVKNQLLKWCNVNIGENTKVVGPIDFGSEIKITIGNNCWIGKNISFDGNGSINIGDNVDIAPHVVMNTGGHEVGSNNKRAGKGISCEIIISNGTWIGTRSTIINNITIEKGVIVAAGSLVNKDIKADVMVAGVPAIVKRSL